MYFILALDWCLPYVSLVHNDNGEPAYFDRREEAERYAEENCAWDYMVIKWEP